MAVLIGDSNNPSRLNYESLRPQESWPQDKARLNTESGIMYVYASPAHKSGIIGDFGATLYFGENEELQNHLVNCMQMNREIFSAIHVGQSFAEIAKNAEHLFQREGLTNKVTSV